MNNIIIYIVYIINTPNNWAVPWVRMNLGRSTLVSEWSRSNAIPSFASITN